MELISQRDDYDRKTSVILAQAAGTNRRYLEAARWLLEHHPDAVQAIERGEMSISQARQRKAEGGKTAGRGRRKKLSQQIDEAIEPHDR